MADEEISNRPRHLTAAIVSPYLRHNQIPPDQIGNLISTVHDALAGLGKPAAEPPTPLKPAIPIRRSVQRDHVVCLECAWRGKILRRHISTAHGLSIEAYRARWNLAQEHPLIAPAYSELRSAAAKQIGLGRKGRTRKVRQRRSQTS